MMEELPIVYLARHGETAWSLTGQHTGATDLPLTDHGELNARALKERLSGFSLRKVFSSASRLSKRPRLDGSDTLGLPAASSA